MTSSAPPPSDPDPMPVAPAEPALEACCGNGCVLCIYDVHGIQMDEWRQKMRAWRVRHPDAPAEAG